MTQNYSAADIEVLSGLDPVKRRPGMYTETSRPNHLAQEVIDNSVDEALAGHANKIEVTIHPDESVEVRDNGRGMPVDIHPEEGVPGIELILTKLHAGGKFSNKNYQFSGGLHGVGVSVVNALSKRLEVHIRRNGKEYNIAYANGGDKVAELEEVGEVGARNTGTTLHFWPDASYFDSANISRPRLKHLLRAKAVLCPGLRVIFNDLKNKEKEEWFFESGLTDYLQDSLRGWTLLPEAPLAGERKNEREAAEWALAWMPEGGELITESYVNLIPTAQGGTHVNGLRTGLIEAVREYCEFRNLLPRGLKLAPEDIFEKLSYVISVKLEDPQFSGQTKERLSSRECAGFVSGVVKDAFSLWLHQHPETGDLIAQHAIANAQTRSRSAKKVVRKKLVSGPALPGKLADCVSDETNRTELFLVEGDSAGGSAKQARERDFQAIMPLRGKILNTWEVDSSEVLASQEIHDISVAIGVDPGVPNIENLRYGKICILADADSDGAHIATLICALFLRHYRPLVEAGHVYVAMPPLYRVDVGKQVFYALDEAELDTIQNRISSEGIRGKVQITRFKGLGEMNPPQLRETTMNPDTRRLVQLSLDPADNADQTMDMLLAKKRAGDRKSWLEDKGNLAEV